ncbi:MAG: hypothetical protein ABEH88_09485, partial [Halobacteriales archaeon]
MDETVALVKRSLDPDNCETFDRRVEAEAAYLREELRSGRLDNADPAVGMELECYAVDSEGRLAAVPEAVLKETPVNAELGVHNVEVNTDPDLLPEGIERQATAIREQFAAAEERSDHRRIVLDAMWTIPPAEGTREYLSAIEKREGVVFAENMKSSARYHALDNDILRHAGGEIELDVPGATVSVPTILIESLATSIQPHLQVPDVSEFPAYHGAAVRTLGPVLALATNSPFLPADLYEDVDPDRLLAETHHELRVAVFEQSINAGQSPGKVRFPEDVEAPAEVVDHVTDDRTLAAFLEEWVKGGDGTGGEGGDRTGDEGGSDEDEEAAFADAFWQFGHKHGTYWRWLRGVIGGDHIGPDNTERSLRIEYRPLPTQPSVTDIVGFQALVTGLLRELVAEDHPLVDLDHDLAEASFYNAVAEGLDAELHWVTASGEHTTDLDRICDELFDLARAGLANAGVEAGTIDRYLGAIEHRWTEGRTPSDWKIDRVRAELDAGADLIEAIPAMQRSYFDRCGTPFAEWPDPDAESAHGADTPGDE